MYHVFFDLEPRFDTLKDAQFHVDCLRGIHPRVPYTCGLSEDDATARVCVAPTPELCMTGIGPGKWFRRCVNGDEIYDNGDEIYPVIVCEVDGDFIKPDPLQVPDADFTQEYWSLEKVCVVSAELKWLGCNSIKVDVRGRGEYVTDIEWVEPRNGLHHPWLDGKGHPLNSSDKGSDPWPPLGLVWDSLYLDVTHGHQLVMIRPHYPPSGYCTCTPMSSENDYIARLSDCKKFTGFFDRDGVPLFYEDYCDVEGKMGTVTLLFGATLAFSCVDHAVVSFAGLRGRERRVLQDVKSFELHSVSVPECFRFPQVRGAGSVNKMQLK